jgi:hypothetical protein
MKIESYVLLFVGFFLGLLAPPPRTSNSIGTAQDRELPVKPMNSPNSTLCASPAPYLKMSLQH